jgi:hypothetical protein
MHPSRPAWLPSNSPVGTSSDLDRILGLPRRPAYDESSDYSALVARLTAEFRRPAGTMTLLPTQAFSIAEARSVGGLVGLIRVGGGKTLLGLLLPVALGVKRAVLLLPSQLKAQLLNRSFPELGKHWRIANVRGADVAYPDTDALIYPVSYSELSSLKQADVLEKYDPELIICDEAHHLRRLESARTRRFDRYVIAASRAGKLKHVIEMSGSMMSNSLRDLRFIRYALGRYAPIPWDEGTLNQWADALDPIDRPCPPGALVKLKSRPEESVRAAFRRRFVETPGVVATTESPLPIRLVIKERPLTLPKSVTDVLAQMRKTWVTPWGEEITDALTFSRYGRQIACGLLYRRIWPRNEPVSVREEWLEARAEWHREVRSYLATKAKEGMDSPLALANAARDGRRPSRNYERWVEVRDLAEPDVEPHWVDDFAVRDAVEWGRQHRGVIWYDHDAFGREVAALGGYPLIDGGQSGEAVLSGLSKFTQGSAPTVVASRHARGTGTDGLQHHYAEQLVTTPSSSGDKWEQLLGRLRRLGQDAPTVTTWVYLHTPECRTAFESARRDAEFLEETTGNQQMLTSATYAGPT